MAEEGETARDVGQRRARREEGSFSYRNAIIAEEDGRPAACLIGYALPDAPEPIGYDTMPAMFVPMQELENLAPGTWYVNVLAAYPEFRGRGIGAGLLALA
jgi:GNAT superfamily N-acetyltransferase